MDREIVFRGNRIDNGEWVEGFYCWKSDPYLPGVIWHFILTQSGDGLMDWHTVDGESIGQFIGLMDKNGKRVFEGDVLLVPASRHGSGQNWYSEKNVHHGKTESVHVFVEFNEHTHGWILRQLDSTQDEIREIEEPRGKERQRQSVSVPTRFYQNLQFEVVGNIHDKEENQQ